MDDREILIGLINDILNYLPWGEVSPHTARELADYLLDNGATIPVRCKDCKHYKPQIKSAHWNSATPYCCRCATVKVSPDDFCSYGERK